MLTIVARRRLPTARNHIRRLIVIGMFGIGLMAVFMGIGVDRGSATIGSIVVGLEPIGVALAGVLLVGDAPSRRSIVALIIGFTGALVASGVFTEHSGPSPVRADHPAARHGRRVLRLHRVRSSRRAWRRPARRRRRHAGRCD